MQAIEIATIVAVSSAIGSPFVRYRSGHPVHWTPPPREAITGLTSS